MNDDIQKVSFMSGERNIFSRPVVITSARVEESEHADACSLFMWRSPYHCRRDCALGWLSCLAAFAVPGCCSAPSDSMHRTASAVLEFRISRSGLSIQLRSRRSMAVKHVRIFESGRLAAHWDLSRPSKLGYGPSRTVLKFSMGSVRLPIQFGIEGPQLRNPSELLRGPVTQSYKFEYTDHVVVASMSRRIEMLNGYCWAIDSISKSQGHGRKTCQNF